MFEKCPLSAAAWWNAKWCKQHDQ